MIILTRQIIERVFLAALILVSTCFCSPTLAEPVAGNQAAVSIGSKAEVVGPFQVELGEFDANETRTATFTIKNAGDELLKFPCIRKTCGCFELACDKTDIKPGESTTIKVSVIKESIFHSFDKHVFVETNDPASPVLRFRVSGTAKPLIEIAPQEKIRVGRISPGFDWKQEIVVKPLRPGVKLGTPKVEGKLQLPVTMMEEKDIGWRLRFRLPAQPEPGLFRCVVKIPVEEPKGWKDIEIQISGEIGK